MAWVSHNNIACEHNIGNTYKYNIACVCVFSILCSQAILYYNPLANLGEAHQEGLLIWDWRFGTI
jgi:hypothetical protein